MVGRVPKLLFESLGGRVFLRGSDPVHERCGRTGMRLVWLFRLRRKMTEAESSGKSVTLQFGMMQGQFMKQQIWNSGNQERQPGLGS